VPLPNLVSPTSITLKNFNAVAGTAASTLVSCGTANSIKVSCVVAANVSAASAGFTLQLNDGSATYAIVSAAAIPANASLLPVTRENPVYLTEGCSIEALASEADAIHVTGSYEDIE
jgi:hypothetical protein